jgi:flagellar basal-body rod protein FlgB
MDLFAGVAPLNGALDYHLERHSILISNVSNVDTPGYVPRDLARTGGPTFEGALGVAMAKTQEGHLAGSATTATTGMVVRDPTAGGGADQNKVSLDREAAKVAANQLRYDVISTLVTSELGDLNFAATDGRGG